MARSVQQLQRLHDELDFANAARAQLDVTRKFLVTHHVALNPAFDCRNLVEQIAAWTLRKDERLMLPQKFVGQLAIAGHAARFLERESLPGFTKTGVVGLHALERAGERPGG